MVEGDIPAWAGATMCSITGRCHSIRLSEVTIPAAVSRRRRALRRFSSRSSELLFVCSSPVSSCLSSTIIHLSYRVIPTAVYHLIFRFTTPIRPAMGSMPTLNRPNPANHSSYQEFVYLIGLSGYARNSRSEKHFCTDCILPGSGTTQDNRRLPGESDAPGASALRHMLAVRPGDA